MNLPPDREVVGRLLLLLALDKALFPLSVFSNTSSDITSSTFDEAVGYCVWNTGAKIFCNTSPITVKLGSTINSIKPKNNNKKSTLNRDQDQRFRRRNPHLLQVGQ